MNNFAIERVTIGKIPDILQTRVPHLSHFSREELCM